MRSKVIDVDIHQLERIDGLEDYDAVEILFRDGREPLGRARIPCNGNSLEAEKIRPMIKDLPPPSPLDVSDKLLPTVTVAICTRNRSDELANALYSLARQEYPADEIVVVDNGCQEDIRQLVESILPHARYLQERRPGLDFARNLALSEATSDIIAFLDDDVEADPHWLRSVVECFAIFPEAGAVTGLILPLELETPAQALFEANGGFARGFTRRVLPQDGLRLLGFRLPLVADSIGVGSGCNMAFRTIVLKQLNGFDEALDMGPPLPGGGDLDIFYRVMRAGYQLVYEPRALVRHRHRDTVEEVRAQLAGHHRSLTAFLIKTLGAERGWARFGIVFFLVWRLTKPGVRLARRAAGRDQVPGPLLLRIWWNCWRGLGAYPKAQKLVQVRRERAVSNDGESYSWVNSAGGSVARPSSSRLVALWCHRELLRRLVLRNLKVKYQRSVLGFVWALLSPLLTLAILIAVFSHVVRIPLPYYWAFLLSGYFVWNFFIQTLNTGTYIFSEYSRLLRTAAFPTEILVFSAVIAKLIEFGAAILFAFAAIAILYHHGIPSSLVFFPFLLVIQMLVVIGLALPITTLSVFYWDVQHALPIALTTLFYASPVFYPVSLVPDVIRPFYMLNPIAGLLELYHYVLYEGRIPPLELAGGMLAYSVVIFFFGYALFRRYETVYPEVV